MRILVITPTFLPNIGGAELGIHEIYSRLGERHQVRILCPQPREQTTDVALTTNSYTVERFDAGVSLGRLRGAKLHRGLIPPWTFGSYRPIRDALKQYKPDVINLHYAIDFGLTALIANWKFGIPIVLSLIGRDVPGPDTPSGWKPFVKWISNSSSETIFISEYSRSSLYGASNLERSIVIPYGVNLEQFSAASSISLRNIFSIPSTSPILLGVQRLSGEKRISLALRALASANNKLEQKAYLILVGKGPDEPHLKELSIQLGIESYVKFAGYIGESDLPSYYKGADYLLFTSVYETFGVTLAQAMAAGLPVITTGGTAIDELIVDKVTGFVSPDTNSEELGNTIIRALESKKLAIEMASAASSIALREFDWNKISNSYERILSAARMRNR